MVKNLSYSTTETCLRKEFSNFGQIAEVKLVMDEKAKRSKGYAFIQYTSQDDALLALESMDHKYFDGRVIFVELAKPGRNAFGVYPKTTGPPQEQNIANQDEATE
ncbi:organelle RRM domain-containing protein 6, chloroplastic [Camellia sinensis]|uniref:organelle RRM domain-containing protein 6, chloroplastic n=1 Tax=Camellia sinensis TaxID=4442 RepID=UPI0010366450|nr:organelle RRM domain-containing protein 6, chloroplastic [Camellia sinensis]